MPRFEQIDMFTAVEQASADALPPSPANSAEAPAPYVVRSLSQLTGTKGPSRPSMMAQLLKDIKTENNDADGRA